MISDRALLLVTYVIFELAAAGFVWTHIAMPALRALNATIAGAL